MATLQKQTSLFTEEELTLSPGDFLANPIPLQENEKAKKMRDTSGRRCLEQLERFSRVGSWGRMFLASLIGQEGWYSTKCRLTWKLRGTKYSRLYCQLAVSMLPTRENEFGLLLTPSTVDIGLNEGRIEKRTAYRESVGRHYVPGCLTEQIQGLLPTPDCSDRRSANSKQQGLSNVMKGLIPTPSTRDYKGARTTESLEKAGRNETNSLPDAFHQTGKTSQLNPRFVAEMMGFPPDWLELTFLNTETNQSKDTETPSCHK